MPNSNTQSIFNRNLLLGFGVSLFLLVVSSVASWVSIQNLSESSKWVNHTNVVIARLESISANLNEAETGQRGYLLTGNNIYLTQYRDASVRVLSNLAGVRQLTIDNAPQTASSDQLKILLEKRFGVLQQSINKWNAAGLYDTSVLNAGRSYMDLIRAAVTLMESREKDLLAQRTAHLASVAAVTPVIIVSAGLLAIFITLFFYSRVRSDFALKTKLQKELQEKDADITRRINIVGQVADKISAGNYTIRTSDSGADGLGSLSGSLNKMAESLRYSFTLLSDKEWLQTGLTKLNERMVGEQHVAQLTYNILGFLATYSNSQAGALYLAGAAETLTLASSYALMRDGERNTLRSGEGIAGQCARSGEPMLITNMPDDAMLISFAAGEAKPKNIFAVPVYYESKVTGVIELASLQPFTERTLGFIRDAARQVGIVINTAQSRARLQELLEETQTQSEELQAQHAEMENINAELEAQAQKLQASEEELRVQQEELMQANSELEERAHILEERNDMIAERNREIQQKAEALALSTKYKSEFLANMSHELRTPLNSILLLSRLMSENNAQNLSPEQVEYAEVIQSSGKGLLSLIDEILDLSKIEAGKMELEYNNTSVKSITNDLRALFMPLAREKQIDFSLETTDDVPDVIETDNMRLGQVLKNLLSNAFKFTTQGSVSLRISAEAPGSGIIQFSVKDTGIGIPPEKQHLIFEAFQQADGSTRRKYGGTGLGLSISRELVRLLGGTLRLQSEAGAGAEFTVDLPVNKLVAQERLEAEDAELKTSPEPSPASANIVIPGNTQPAYRTDTIPQEIPDDRASIVIGDKSILIVEDDTPFAKSLLEFTRDRGYKGIVAVRGDDGIALAKHFMPTGILLDIRLPVKDGWEVMEELKSDPATRHIPVHIMSSFEAKKESLQKGAVDFINKPFAFEQMPEVFNKLEHVLNKTTKKVLIVEENPKHAKALAHFLETFQVVSEIAGSLDQSIAMLQSDDTDCVILDMGIPDSKAYDMLEMVKKNKGLENLPIIIFTGKSLSRAEDQRIRQYADSIIIKTAHSYRRLLDEVSLFLHLMETQKANGAHKPRKLGGLTDVLKGKTVLLADDDVRNIFSLTKSLEAHGVHVISATDGREALRLLSENPAINIVLMDMMMPEMDGYESTARIRSNPKTKHLPVIAVTAKAMTGDREKCIKAGASDYISKPVDIDQLLSLLRVWLYE